MALLGLFGPGTMFVTRTDIANATPVNIGYANEFSIDITAESKELFGQNDYPLLVATGTRKVTAKVKAAVVSGMALNSVFLGGGGSLGTGQTKMAINESGTVPSTPYQITVANGATFVRDLGVTDASTGQPLTKVASGPTTGQYSVNTTGGIYTFASADTGKSVLISYVYTVTGTGQKQSVIAQPIGTTTTFRFDYQITTNGQSYYIGATQCISNKLTHAFKLSDFDMPEIDFACFSDATGKVFDLSYGNIG